MFKVAGKIISMADDPRFMGDPEFRARFDPVLEFDKHASMPQSSFALVLKGMQEHRHYPVHTKEACAFSASYFTREHDTLHPVFQAVAATQLKIACEIHGVPVSPEIEQLVHAQVRSNVVDLRKLGSDELVPETRAEQFNKMANWWLENERHMTLDERNTKADRLVKEAEELDLRVVHPRIINYTTKPQIGPRFKMAVDIRAKICERMGLEGGATEYRELARGLDGTMVKRAVERLFTADEKFGMKTYYGKIADPYVAVFGPSETVLDQEKTASNEAMRYKLDTIAAQSSDYIEGLSSAGVAQFKKDPYGTFMGWPKVMQDYVLAKFEHAMHDAAADDEGISGHTTDAELKLRTKNLKGGKHEYEGVHKLTRKGKHPTITNMPIAVASKA